MLETVRNAVRRLKKILDCAFEYDDDDDEDYYYYYYLCLKLWKGLSCNFYVMIITTDIYSVVPVSWNLSIIQDHSAVRKPVLLSFPYKALS